jgi:selenoprotein W-related protein
LATKVLTHFKQELRGMELEPSSGGCFELSVNGELVYSKLKTGQFPDEDVMVAEIARRL